MKPPPSCTIPQEVLHLVVLDGVVVGVEQQAIELLQVIVVTQRLLDRGGVVEVDGVAPERLGDHRVVFVGRVVGRLVAEEQDADRACFLAGVERAEEDG